MSRNHETPAPVSVPFWTPGTGILFGVMVIGAIFLYMRFAHGLGVVTNLSDANPWGIWIGIDVASGVALAAGGFTTAFVAHVLGKHEYEPIVRPALLTAVLGYTFVVIGLFADLGRYWAIWHPVLNWQPNSVLFEVAMCVMVYLTVLYVEFFPVIAEKFGEKIKILASLNKALKKVMWFFVILGVVLSCMHQSSLGSLMLIAPTKTHPLWYTPILPLLFLISAFTVGYPMVVFESTLASRSFNLDPETGLLGKLIRYTIFLLGLYMVLKIGDLYVRGAYVYLTQWNAQTIAFIAEMLLGVIIPFTLLLLPAVRRSRHGLFIACTMIVGGVLLNRINVFTVAYNPPYAQTAYVPAFGEIAVTVGLIATLIFLYRLAAIYLPVFPAKKASEGASS